MEITEQELMFSLVAGTFLLTFLNLIYTIFILKGGTTLELKGEDVLPWKDFPSNDYSFEKNKKETEDLKKAVNDYYEEEKEKEDKCDRMCKEVVEFDAKIEAGRSPEERILIELEAESVSEGIQETYLKLYRGLAKKGSTQKAIKNKVGRSSYYVTSRLNWLMEKGYVEEVGEKRPYKYKRT